MSSKKGRPRQPLAEVFGFRIDDHSELATKHRTEHLCPYKDKFSKCTKVEKLEPLGVCSLFEKDHSTIICPTRFRQDDLIVSDAASFFFPSGTHRTSLQEIRLYDKNGKSAGNIDLVVVSYDDNNEIIDYGALEIQGVYITGNIRKPFQHYMKDPKGHAEMDWSDQHPHADYLSSSRKRLVPQLLFKGGILHAWKKKMAVAIDTHFFDRLPPLPTVDKADAEIAWLIYDLIPDQESNRYQLNKTKTVYTLFTTALEKITTAESGTDEKFRSQLQNKLRDKLANKATADQADDEGEVDPDNV